MIRLFFKTLWNNRRRTILVFIELFMISLVLINLSIYLVNMLAIYRIKNCYDTKNVVLIEIRKKNDEDPKISEVAFQNVKKVIKANPFVEAVSICHHAIPYNYNAWRSEFKCDSDRIYVDPRLVDFDYERVMKINPIKGRWFNETDLGKKAIPATVSVDIEKKFLKGNAVGKRLKEGNTEYEVIGVTERFKRSDIESPDEFGFILSDSVNAKRFWGADILVRTKENKTEEMLAIAERQVYSTLNPDNWTINSLNSLENMHAQQNSDSYQRNYVTVIIALFIMINIFLGTIGILWYNTNLRIHEIGIKRALGFTGRGVERQLMAENLVIGSIALLLVILIMVQTPKLVWGGQPEPGVFFHSIVISAVIMIALVLLSTWLPANIASKIKPATALKTE